MDKRDKWAVGSAYEPFVGRWSRLIAPQFVHWLSVDPKSSWLDVGCGTGALSTAILEHADPRSLMGIDPSEGFVSHARAAIQNSCADFQVGDAMSLAFDDGAFDAAVSGLVLNFVPDAMVAVSEMRRAVRAGGLVGSYVWDYADGMQMLRLFWEAAVELDPSLESRAEVKRFPLCQPDALANLFTSQGLRSVEVRSIEVDSYFRDFSDFWLPFLGGQGPAAGHATSLSEPERVALLNLLRRKLPESSDGSITLLARAWAVKGRKD